MDEQIIESWQINNRVNLYLLDAIKPEALAATPTGMKGRSVGELFAHMHNMRWMWIEATDSGLVQTVTKISLKTKADREALTKDLLGAALSASADATSKLLRQSMERGKVRNTKLSIPAFLGYLLTHEGYHRGEICMTLTEAGHKLPDDVMYGIWDWDKR
jgi:uncharacterized damage-inducible protein DinB